MFNTRQSCNHLSRCHGAYDENTNRASTHERSQFGTRRWCIRFVWMFIARNMFTQSKEEFVLWSVRLSVDAQQLIMGYYACLQQFSTDCRPEWVAHEVATEPYRARTIFVRMSFLFFDIEPPPDRCPWSCAMCYYLQTFYRMLLSVSWCIRWIIASLYIYIYSYISYCDTIIDRLADLCRHPHGNSLRVINSPYWLLLLLYVCKLVILYYDFLSCINYIMSYDSIYISFS